MLYLYKVIVCALIHCYLIHNTINQALLISYSFTNFLLKIEFFTKMPFSFSSLCLKTLKILEFLGCVQIA